MLTKYIDVGGVPTRCLIAGDAGNPGLLLIHGQTLTAEIWMRVLDAFAEHWFVVAPDMLGHGFTRPPAGQEKVSIPAKVEHLRNLVDALGIRRYSVGGSSYGALMGTHLYFADAGRVDKLIINGSGSSFNTEEQLVRQLDQLYANYHGIITALTPEQWREKMAPGFYDAASIPPEMQMILPLCYALPGAEESWEYSIQSMRDLPSFRRYRILDRLGEIKSDALVVWGRQDRGGNYESAVAAVAKMPRAKLVSFDRCGHMPMLEHPQDYKRIVAEFLKN
jgi:2-hydroxy-6-oxonona-2,4-dienedioate hydrolase